MNESKLPTKRQRMSLQQKTERLVELQKKFNNQSLDKDSLRYDAMNDVHAQGYFKLKPVKSHLKKLVKIIQKCLQSREKDRMIKSIASHTDRQRYRNSQCLTKNAQNSDCLIVKHKRLQSLPADSEAQVSSTSRLRSLKSQQSGDLYRSPLKSSYFQKINKNRLQKLQRQMIVLSKKSGFPELKSKQIRPKNQDNRLNSLIRIIEAHKKKSFSNQHMSLLEGKKNSRKLSQLKALDQNRA